MAYSARPIWLLLGGLSHRPPCSLRGLMRAGLRRGRWESEWSVWSVGDGAGGAGLEKVMLAVKSSPAKKADWEGVTVTVRRDVAAVEGALAAMRVVTVRSDCAGQPGVA